MRRCGSISSPLVAAALLLVLLVAACFHGVAAARLMPPSSVPVPAALVDQENRVTTAADGGLVLQEGGVAVDNGDELSSIPEMMGAELAEEDARAACEESNEDCMQRRLLHEAHLDYIYTQHKGKP